MKEKVNKTTTELLEEIKHLPDLELEKDPEFIEDYTKGIIIEDILKLMEAKGISKSDLAKKMRKSHRYIRNILNGQNNFTVKTLVKLASALESEILLKMVLINTKYDDIL
ncbi:MAG: helix-turn-helix transcriptional regulator [Spirochaetia bacterium]|jgi:ribosome-binding protein aMBF1 (putative translation factor)|nr:helix-turn-helix transcriptional regulator [Spirochaetia bacterium]